jgi:hypothetical protein
MDEGRKRVLLIAASILAARRLAWDGKPSPAFVAAISDAVRIAERIMKRIDDEWPSKAWEFARFLRGKAFQKIRIQTIGRGSGPNQLRVGNESLEGRVVVPGPTVHSGAIVFSACIVVRI